MDVSRALSSTPSYPVSASSPWSNQGLSSSLGSAASLEIFREEPEVGTKVRLELKQRDWTEPCGGSESSKWWWQSIPGIQVHSGRLRLFHVYFSEDGSGLSSQDPAQELASGPVVRTWCFHFCAPGTISVSGTKTCKSCSTAPPYPTPKKGFSPSEVST